VAISWGDYFRSFLNQGLGISIPPWLGMDPRTALEISSGWLQAQSLASAPALGERLTLLAQARSGAVSGADVFTNWATLSQAPLIGGFPFTINLFAVLITIGITWLCYVGIRESARANTVMVILKLVILSLVAGIGAAYINPENYTPFAPNGWKGIQAGAGVIFFAFIGFDALSTCAEECKNPARDLPRGIIISLIVCTIFYVMVTAVVTGMLHYTQLAGVADPLAKVFEVHKLTGMATIISFGAIIATAACLLVYQVGQPRIMMAMSRDGLLGPWFGKVHSRHGTPANATILTGLLVALPAALMNISEVVDLTNIGTLFAFAIVCAGVIIMRVKRPDVPRRFRVPAVWLTAPAGIFSCFWLAWELPVITWWRFLGWLLAGLVIYFIYGMRRSALGKQNPAA